MKPRPSVRGREQEEGGLSAAPRGARPSEPPLHAHGYVDVAPGICSGAGLHPLIRDRGVRGEAVRQDDPAAFDGQRCSGPRLVKTFHIDRPRVIEQLSFDERARQSLDCCCYNPTGRFPLYRRR